MNIVSIDEIEYMNILKSNNKDIPIWTDSEAIEYYTNKEIIKVCKGEEDIAVFLIPLNNGGIRREYRYFPYISPIILKQLDNYKQKMVLKQIFNYLFKKYDYAFIPLHPDFKMVAAIQSEGGFIEMRHTHILDSKITFNDLSSKVRNHINNANKKMEILIDYDYTNFDFSAAIKGSDEEVIKRSSLAKKIIDNKKAIVVKGIYQGRVISGLIVAYDKKWAYLLHSYQDKSIRGSINLLIFKAINYAFDNLNIQYFDFEGSVIEQIDNFFATFNAQIVTYPYLIYAKDDKKYWKLICRSKNIIGRIREYNENIN